MKAGCKQGCALLVLPIVAGIGYVGYTLWQARTPAKVGEDFRRLSVPQKTERRQATQKLEAQIRDLSQAARRKEHKRFSLPISESQLNTILQDRLDTSKFPIRDLKAGLSPQRLTLQGRVLYKGIDAVATLSGNIVAKDNALRYESESLNVGGLPINALKAKVDKQVTKALNKLLEKAPGRIERVEIGDKSMTIQGVTD